MLQEGGHLLLTRKATFGLLVKAPGKNATIVRFLTTGTEQWLPLCIWIATHLMDALETLPTATASGGGWSVVANTIKLTLSDKSARRPCSSCCMGEAKIMSTCGSKSRLEKRNVSTWQQKAKRGCKLVTDMDQKLLDL